MRGGAIVEGERRVVQGIERVNTLVYGLVHAAGLAALLAAASATPGDVFHGVLFDIIHCVEELRRGGGVRVVWAVGRLEGESWLIVEGKIDC